MENGGTPQHSIMNRTASAAVYEAARRRAALVDRSDRGRIVISGADRASYLQGLLTNDIAALSAGSGCYTAYLTAQGRMIADAWVYELGDVILMIVDAGVASSVLARLDQFIFSEDVQLGDVSGTFTQTGIIGPASAAILEEVTGVAAARLDAMPEHGNARTDVRGAPVMITRTTDAGEPGFDLFVERSGPIDISAALERADVPTLDHETAEAIRIEAGVPKFHRDMDEDTIPLEAGIESRAISFTKGCYVGQEVIIRVMHRGHGRVARRLVGLSLTGDVPLPSVPVRSGEREVGRVTSRAFSPGLERPIALAYVHRDFVEPGTELNVDGHVAVVSALPFLKPGRP
jgi:folate-binding protein YgfZ